jgi:hypothetical protein
MARMIPATVNDNTVSSAERKLFTLFQAQLSSGWTVLHSLGVASHAKKPWAEIDFVLIGPEGVYCLEAKGGGVSRHGGVWHFTDRYGNISTKREGPFEQVGSASAALYRFLTEHCRAYQGFVGYGVMMPDIVFQEEGPDIDLDVVYDAYSAERSMQDYIDRLAVYWRKRLKRMGCVLSQNECNSVLDALRGDFDFHTPLSRVAEDVCDELLSLTIEQYKALDTMQENPRCIIKGGAGTGKTLLAAEEARRAARENKRVLLCCYSRNLAAFLKRAIEEENIEIESLHQLMYRHISAASLTSSLPNAEKHYLFEVGYPQTCLEALTQLDDFLPFDTLIVDEAQDLMLDTYLDVLDVLVKGGLEQGTWRFFSDPKQNVFKGIQQGIHERLRRSYPAIATLHANCRNTRPIAVNTALLCGLAPDDVARAGGPEVEMYWFRDRSHEHRMLSKFVNRVLSEGMRPEQITILSPYQLAKSVVANGINCPRSVADITDSGSPVCGSIGFSTIPGFKGLEGDVVAVVDLDQLLSPEMTSFVYVAASRPRVLLSVFIDEQSRGDFEQRSREFGEQVAVGS